LTDSIIAGNRCVVGGGTDAKEVESSAVGNRNVSNAEDTRAVESELSTDNVYFDLALQNERDGLALSRSQAEKVLVAGEVAVDVRVAILPRLERENVRRVVAGRNQLEVTKCLNSSSDCVSKYGGIGVDPISSFNELNREG